MVRLAAFVIVFCLSAVPARAQTPWLLVPEVVGRLGTAVDAGLEIHDEARLRSLRADVLALNDRIARLTAEQTVLTSGSTSTRRIGSRSRRGQSRPGKTSAGTSTKSRRPSSC